MPRPDIGDVRAGLLTVKQAARIRGCKPKYLEQLVWQAVKVDVLERDGACVICSRPDGMLDVHHRMARGSGGTSVAHIAFGMANLITLCREHHMWVEGNPDEAREHGWKLDHGDTLPADLEVLRFGATVRLFDDGSFLAVAA